MTNLTKEEQHAADNYRAACQKAHENVTEDTNKISRKTFKWVKYIGIIVITWLCSVCYDRYFGSVINGGLSRQEVCLELDELRQTEEWVRLLEGILWDDTKYLDSAKRIIRYRSDGTVRGAEFTDLTIIERQKLVEISFKLCHAKVLEWVKKQPNWDEGLNRDAVNMVKWGPERNGGLTIEQWKEKYYTMKKHHNEMEHDEDYVNLKETEKLLAFSQAKLNWGKETQLAMSGFLTNNINKLAEVQLAFKDWNPELTEDMLEFAINAFHLEALEWVVEQPEWHSIVNEQLVNKINLFLKDYSFKH